METIERFFKEYASASITGNAEQVAEFYAQNFMAATKNESSAFSNDEKFIAWLNDVFKFNQQVGLQKMKVKKIESHSIGQHFSEVTVTWSTIFAKKPEKEISFDIHYILNSFHVDLKIVLYISEEDQEELMKKEGLI